MPAAPWPVRLELGLRLPRAPKQDLRAWKDGGAHRELSGGERGVREGSEAGRRRRPRTGERKGTRVKANPGETRSIRVIRGTFGCGETR